MGKFYWLKLKDDFFEDKQIKYLLKLPSGSDMVIVYQKMQLKALKTEGLLRYDKILPSCSEELAMVLDADENIVKMTIAYLLKVGAVQELDDGSLYMFAMQELIGKEGDSAERVRRFREKQQAKALQCNGEVTNSNTEIEKRDKRKEIEKDKTPNGVKATALKNKTEKSDVTKLKESYYQTYLNMMKREPCTKEDSTAFWKTVMAILKKKLKEYDLNTLLKVLEYATNEDWVIEGGFIVSTVFCDTVIQRTIQNAPHGKPQKKKAPAPNYVTYTNTDEVDLSDCPF